MFARNEGWYAMRVPTKHKTARRGRHERRGELAKKGTRETREKEEGVTRSFNFRPWYVRSSVKIKSIGELHPLETFLFLFLPSPSVKQFRGALVHRWITRFLPSILFSFLYEQARDKRCKWGRKNDKIVGKFGNFVIPLEKDSYVVSRGRARCLPTFRVKLGDWKYFVDAYPPFFGFPFSAFWKGRIVFE